MGNEELLKHIDFTKRSIEAMPKTNEAFQSWQNHFTMCDYTLGGYLNKDEIEEYIKEIRAYLLIVFGTPSRGVQ